MFFAAAVVVVLTLQSCRINLLQLRAARKCLYEKNLRRIKNPQTENKFCYVEISITPHSNIVWYFNLYTNPNVFPKKNRILYKKN